MMQKKYTNAEEWRHDLEKAEAERERISKRNSRILILVSAGMTLILGAFLAEHPIAVLMVTAALAVGVLFAILCAILCATLMGEIRIPEIWRRIKQRHTPRPDPFLGRKLRTDEVEIFLRSNSIKYGVVRSDDPEELIYYWYGKNYAGGYLAQSKDHTTSMGWLPEAPDKYEGTELWTVVERYVFPHETEPDF